MNKWIDHARSCLVQWLYPPTCLFCGAHGDDGLDLCKACLADLPWNHICCRHCALPLPQPAERCGRCLQHTPAYDAALAPMIYAPPADFLIKSLKFHDRPACARLIGELIARSLHDRDRSTLPECLLPVPLHPARLRERGFNQAIAIARPLARRLGLPLDLTGAHRIRHTAAQSTLPADRRRANVRGAFEVRPDLPWRHVAIIDDVVTTGHTVDELARALRRAGAERVEVWAWAKTER